MANGAFLFNYMDGEIMSDIKTAFLFAIVAIGIALFVGFGMIALMENMSLQGLGAAAGKASQAIEQGWERGRK